MKKILRGIGKAILALFIATSFFSCASTGVESQEGGKNKGTEYEELEYYKSPYYDQFINMFTADNHDPAMEDLFAKWGAESKDGDYYKSCFTYYFNMAIELSNNYDSIPDDAAYIVLKEDENILVYRNCIMDKATFEYAVNYLKEGVKKYPNRLDLWDVLLKVYDQYYFYYDLKNAVLDFIDVTYNVDSSSGIWYIDLNNVGDITEFSDRDSYTRNLIFSTSASIIDYFPVEESDSYYEEIFAKLAELYPEDPDVLSELGYIRMFSDIDSAITLLEKSYELSGKKTCLKNLIICFGIKGDMEKLEYYLQEVLNTEDIELIYAVEQDLKAMGLLE